MWSYFFSANFAPTSLIPTPSRHLAHRQSQLKQQEQHLDHQNPKQKQLFKVPHRGSSQRMATQVCPFEISRVPNLELATNGKELYRQETKSQEDLFGNDDVGAVNIAGIECERNEKFARTSGTAHTPGPLFGEMSFTMRAL